MKVFSKEECFELLNKQNNNALFRHLIYIVENEPTHSTFHIGIQENKDDIVVFLVISNKIENYWNINIFCMDSVEKKQDIYRNHSFSLPETIALHKFLTSTLRI